jgi:hypothetical protein
MVLIHWQSNFTLGFSIVTVVSEHASLLTAVWNTIASDDLLKVYSVECIIMKYPSRYDQTASES